MDAFPAELGLMNHDFSPKWWKCVCNKHNFINAKFDQLTALKETLGNPDDIELADFDFTGPTGVEQEIRDCQNFAREGEDQLRKELDVGKTRVANAESCICSLDPQEGAFKLLDARRSAGEVIRQAKVNLEDLCSESKSLKERMSTMFGDDKARSMSEKEKRTAYLEARRTCISERYKAVLEQHGHLVDASTAVDVLLLEEGLAQKLGSRRNDALDAKAAAQRKFDELERADVEVKRKMRACALRRGEANLCEDELRTELKNTMQSFYQALEKFDRQRVEHRCLALVYENLSRQSEAIANELPKAKVAAQEASEACDSWARAAFSVAEDAARFYEEVAIKATKHSWPIVIAAASNCLQSAAWLKYALDDKQKQVTACILKKQKEDALLRALRTDADLDQDELEFQCQSQVDKCEACEKEIAAHLDEQRHLQEALHKAKTKFEGLQNLEQYGQNLSVDLLGAEAEATARSSFGEFPTLFKTGTGAATAGRFAAGGAIGLALIPEVVTPEMVQLRLRYEEQRVELERLRADMQILQRQQVQGTDATSDTSYVRLEMGDLQEPR